MPDGVQYSLSDYDYHAGVSLPGALAALLLPAPAHGYQLQAMLEAELGPLWETSASQVYLTLGRMVRDRLVTSRRVRQAARPDRHLLELTAGGRRLAVNWLFEAGPPDEIVVRLAVARLAVPTRFAELVDTISAQRSSALRRLRALREMAGQGFQREAIEAEILHAQSELRWLGLVGQRSREVLGRPAASRSKATVERYA